MNLSDLQIPKIKISVRILAIILGIIGLAFFWWINTKKLPELEAEVAKYETENKSLSETEKNLTNLYNNMDFYLDETTRINDETEDLLSEFPTFMYLEDKILYSDTLLKTDFAGYNITEFRYGQSNYEMNVTYGNEQTLELYSVTLSGKFNDLTYMEVKEIIDYGLSSSQRFVLNNISMAYNEKTGYLSGELSFDTYFIPGQAEPYVFPQEVIDNMGSSNRVNDLFGARQ